MSSIWPSWGSSGSMAIDGTQNPPASASSAPVQSEMSVTPNSVHRLHLLVAHAKEMQRDIAGRATKDDLDGLRDLVQWQIAALSDLSIRGQEQVDSLSARVRELETARRCSSVADRTENTALLNTTDPQVSRSQRQGRLDRCAGNDWPDSTPKRDLPPVMPLWPITASPVVFVQDSWPNASGYGAIGSHLRHDRAVGVGVTGEWAQSSRSTSGCFMDSLLDKEMAWLEVNLYKLCDDDPINAKEPLSEPSDLPVSVVHDTADSFTEPSDLPVSVVHDTADSFTEPSDLPVSVVHDTADSFTEPSDIPVSVVHDTADSGVESGPDTLEPSLAPMEVRDFYPPVSGREQEKENYFSLLTSVGHCVLSVAVRMVGSLFFGQSF